MARSRILVFASGSNTGGGSGFEKLVEASRNGILDADIVAVVSNHKNGGVREKADRLRVPFLHFFGPLDSGSYSVVVNAYKSDYVALSGWLKLVIGLDPKTTFNIHPGPLPDFGGPGMYGHHVHEAVVAAARNSKLRFSAVSMHFVTDEYDRGPVFFSLPVFVLPSDTGESLGARVNWFEHKFQSEITNLVVTGKIFWDGRNPKSLHVPANYQFLP